MAVKVREVRGIWRVMVDWKGRRVSRNVGRGKDGKRSAEQSAQQIAAKLALGDASVLSPPTPPAAVPTFKTYVERWLTTTVPLRCKPSTVDHYRGLLARHWTPVLGDLPLTAITRERIKEQLGRLATTHRASSIRGNLLVALQACLSAAVEDGWLLASPAGRLGRHVRSDRLPQERLDPFPREELAQLLATAETDMPEWFPFCLTLARTGLRIGEVIALRPEDLDFRARCLWVRRAAYKRRVSTPKNGKGRRVDMSRQLTETLQGWLTLREAEAVVNGTAPSPWLFPGPKGDLLNPNRFAFHVWRPLLRRAGLRYRNPHQLRHSFASLLIAQGESLPYVRDQLGHHSISLTVDVYGHLIPGANRQAVDRLDDPDPASIRNPRATTESASGPAAR